MHAHPSADHLALHKTLSFAFVHFSVALLVGRLLTGSWLIASAMALIEPACNTVAYFLHERYWLRRQTHAPHPAHGGA